MDYTLMRLSDAFRANISSDRRDYRLYAILLATSMEREFLANYLLHFHDLHYLTGRYLLVLGPEFAGNVVPGRERVTREDLDALAAVIAHRAQADASGTTNLYLRFFSAQTRESYDVARHLGVRLDAIPAVAFLDSLEAHANSVLWPLSGTSFEAFATGFRSLCSDLQTRCGWDTEDRLRRLQESAWSREEILRQRRALLAYREALADVRREFDSIVQSSPKPPPTTELRKSIVVLETGSYPPAAIPHLIAHARRWSQRISPAYRDAVNRLADRSRGVGAWDASQRIDALRMTTTADALDAELLELETKLSNRETPLQVVRAFLGLSVERPVAASTIARGLNDVDGTGPVRVFISYARSPHSLRAQVVGLAQALRRRAFDAWMDDFEVSPSAGFPRWMVDQIVHADKVVVVCTTEYRSRFESPDAVSGVTFEGHIIHQELYDSGARTSKFIPVTVDGLSTRDDVPSLLRGFPSFSVPSELDRLCAFIAGTPPVEPLPIRGRAIR